MKIFAIGTTWKRTNGAENKHRTLYEFKITGYSRFKGRNVIEITCKTRPYMGVWQEIEFGYLSYLYNEGCIVRINNE